MDFPKKKAEQALHHRDLLAQVCVVTARTPDAREAVQAIADLLADHLDSWVLEVWLFQSGDSLGLMARSVSGSIPVERRENLKSSAPRVRLDDPLPVSQAARSGKSRTWRMDDSDLDPTSRENLQVLEADEVTALPIRDDGQVLGVVVITPPPPRSVTGDDEDLLDVVLGNMAILLRRLHQLESERGRTRQLHRLECAIESLPIVVKIMSSDWVIEYINPAVEEVLGYAPDELVGESISLIRPSGPSSRQREVAQALRDDGGWAGDLFDHHKDGRMVPVRLVVARVEDENGEIDGIIEIAKDLSMDVDRERRAKGAYRMAVVGELAASVAHEVNNPLSAITMLTRVLMDGTLPEGLREDVELINAEAHRAGGITRNLLVFARESGFEREPVDLGPIVREVLRLKEPQLRLWGIRADVQEAPGLPPAMANSGHIRQILHNLISNAADAIQEYQDEGLIVVKLSAGDRREWIELVVEDDGPGIPADALGRVMEPFYTTKAVGKGTGLGLSVCRDLAEDAGGWMRIENRAGEGESGDGRSHGTRVTIGHPPTSSVEGGSSARKELPRRAEPARLLIIDDDAAVVSALERLARRLGYSVETEHRAKTGLERILEGERFDVIICDLNMPAMGGEDFYRELKNRRPALLDTLVIMSGELAPEASNQFLRESSLKTLAKPFTPDQLQAVMESVIGRS